MLKTFAIALACLVALSSSGHLVCAALVTAPGKCVVHRCSFETERLLPSPGCGYRLSELLPGYASARRKKFPNIQVFIRDIEPSSETCQVRETEYQYCPKCRVAEDVWVKKHSPRE